MCRFKSGIIMKNKIELTPIYNESHSSKLKNMNISDDSFGARKVFVRAELIPPNGDISSDIDTWEFVVDQDIVPDWYEEDPKKYEDEFREKVKEWVTKNITFICGEPCTILKKDEDNIYFHTCNSLFQCQFGSNNNYVESHLRNKLLECDFTQNLINQYKGQLIPVKMDLTSMDGLKDYGEISGDLIGIPDLNLYRECRENIFVGDKWWWLSTPNSTSSGLGASDVRCVGDGGYVNYNDCDWSRDVRPFFILPSLIFESSF